ncbi:FAD-binding domain-containing protein [Mycena rebaudengoi]|nr:FAD-binding domain-containing protein [Mycena rebaudengoi]
MGLIIIDKPILWHSSRVPGEYNWDKMTPEQIKLIRTRFHDWYTADLDYGQGTLIFFCVAIGLAALVNRVSWMRAGSVAHGLKSPPTPRFFDRLTATVRYANSRQYYLPRVHWYGPPLSALIAVGIMFAFVMGLILGPHTYYWPNPEMGHSQPIATRSGLAFATKVNFVGMLTSTSHEKLQVFHRWSAKSSLVHTFPFIVMDMQMGTLRRRFLSLVPQTYLVGLSWGIFRGPYYETFKNASGVFMAGLFIHVDFTLSAWDYFIATGAIYLLAWFARVLRTIYITHSGIPAFVESVDGGTTMLKVAIRAPKHFAWAPGQHVFVRFFGLGMLHTPTSHPFTVSSLHTPSGNGEDNMVDLLMRVRGGITRALAEKVASKPGWATRVVVDGPYGGLQVPLKTYDSVVLLAGSSGATFALPLLLDLAQGLKTAGAACNHVEVVVSVRERDVYGWMEPTVAAASALLLDPVHFTAQVYITRPGESDGKIEDDSATDEQFFERGRPNLAEIVRKAHLRAGRVAVVACGPDSFLYDVRNAVAQCQFAIVDGFGVCTDMYRHTETYSLNLRA